MTGGGENRIAHLSLPKEQGIKESLQPRALLPVPVEGFEPIPAHSQARRIPQDLALEALHQASL